MLYSQSISGGFEHHGEGQIKLQFATSIKENWKSIGGGFYSPSPGKIIYFPDENFGKDEFVQVTVAARLEKDFFDMVWELSAKLSSLT